MGTLSATGGYPFPPRVSGGGGGGSISFTKVNRDGTKEIRVQKSSDSVVPAGWVEIEVLNESFDTDIKVNGKVMRAGGRWNGSDFVDWAAMKIELGPTVTIEAFGQPYVIKVTYPTSSAVDVTTI